MTDDCFEKIPLIIGLNLVILKARTIEVIVVVRCYPKFRNNMPNVSREYTKGSY